MRSFGSGFHGRWVAGGAAAVVILGVLTGLRCGNTSAPIFVQGVEPTDSLVPELSIIRPNANLSISQGQGLQIEWRDQDIDSNATISFNLVNATDPGVIIRLVDGIEETPDGVGDRFTSSTSFVPLGTYTIQGTIDDGRNRPVTVVALNSAAGIGQVIVSIVEAGTTSIVNRPPQVFVRDPMFNVSVSQDDTLVVVVQPTLRDPNLNPMFGEIVDTPFDPDSNATLYLVLDLDDDPLNDDVVAVPSATNMIIPIIEEPMPVTQGDNLPVTFAIPIDLERIPLRSDGSAYNIRATITDGLNAAVHSYARGTINVVRAATGIVDLSQIGRTLGGATFRGFNPGSTLGTKMVNIRDFDLDGIDDFVLVAQFGNPRNFGNAGEAYLIYGLDRIRFGGQINVNSTSRTISGVIFEGPPTRCFNGCMLNEGTTAGGLRTYQNPRTDGITSVSIVPDLSGDGRPELLFGMAHVDGVYQSRDDDPDDNPPEGDETVEVAITLRQGGDGLEVEIEDEPEPPQGYFGVGDALISGADPDRNFRSDDLEWVNRGGNDITFSLIKFTNLLQVFPPGDTPDRITGIGGEITLNLLNAGGGATVHELINGVDFNASTVTFDNFVGGGAPVAGIHYDAEEIEQVNADDVGGEITIDMDVMLQRLLINDLPGGEIRLIIVPSAIDEENADNNARVASSEFPDRRFRPRLGINYDREIQGGPFGCYPDSLPNNFSDEGNGNVGQNEDKLEAIGFVALLHSENRDNDGLVRLDRLSDTVVSLELVGQRTRGITLNGQIVSEAENDEEGRIDGCRFQTGWYDHFDADFLGQPPINDLFGQDVSFIEDLNLDNRPEMIFSAPRNELDYLETLLNFGLNATHAVARFSQGSIIVQPGTNYDGDGFRDKAGEDGTSCIPYPDDESESACADPGSCDPQNPISRCGQEGVGGTFEIFAEFPTDFLGGASSAGDFNLDSVPDLLCGAPLNDRSEMLLDTGSAYIIYGRSPVGDILLANANDPQNRPPMLRIRGERPGDQIGWRQTAIRDVNGDRIDDVMLSSPMTDFILPVADCLAPTAGIGLDTGLFNSCRSDERLDEIFTDDLCKAYDFNNDRRVDDADRDVFDCLVVGGTDCCPVDNGYVGVVFGGVDRQGDRTISQVGTTELPGLVFFGSNPGDRAGHDISTGGDYDKDGFGDILITAPGERRIDANGRERLGVTYLVFGGPHLQQQEAPVDLSEIGERIPGIVFLTPYPSGAPDEAPTDFVGFLGDINNDGFSDIGIGVSRADLLDDQFPQGDGDPNSTGRRPDQGDVYVIYGNNIGR